MIEVLVIFVLLYLPFLWGFCCGKQYQKKQSSKEIGESKIESDAIRGKTFYDLRENDVVYRHGDGAKFILVLEKQSGKEE